MNIASIKARLRKLLYVKGLVYRTWYTSLRLRHAFTRKIRVGFGPITSGENDLAERKWRIDPIVNQINKNSDRYAAGVFIAGDDMSRFDMVVIVKKFNPSFLPVIKHIKDRGGVCIYDVVDNPNCEPRYLHYFKNEPEFLSCVDGYILSTPLHQSFVNSLNKPSTLIEHPIIHKSKKKDYLHRGCIKILAHGYYDNLTNLKWLEPVIASLSKKLSIDIILHYHSEVVLEDTQWVKYIRWTKDNSFDIMKHMDIAISIKRLNMLHQKTKPSTKVIAFMAAGLPVICLPTVADRMVISHGVNGFFAFNPDDWIRIITQLVTNPARRKQIGRAARASVINQYTVPKMTERYLKLFDEVLLNESR